MLTREFERNFTVIKQDFSVQTKISSSRDVFSNCEAITREFKGEWLVQSFIFDVGD